jgi:tetratricopeptide (TPR) repeat protein
MISTIRLRLFAPVLLAALAIGAPPGAQGLFAQSGKIIQLTRAGKYTEALPLAQAMLADQEKRPPSRDLAGALNNLAEVYSGMGRDAEAEPLHKRALAVMEKAVGLDSVDIAIELNNLAALYQRQQRYAEAEPLFKRALALSERSLPANHPDIGRALNNLATNYEKQDHHAESEALTRRALALYQKIPAPSPQSQRS